MGTSHSPQLNTGPEWWPEHGQRDRANPELYDLQGRHVKFDELLAKAGDAFAREITPEKWQRRYDACQKGIERLSETLARAKPDVLVMIGDDQEELYHDDNMPAMLVYWGETMPHTPHYLGPAMSPAMRAASWAYGEDTCEYPIASDLGLHLIQQLVAREFDVSHSRVVKPEGRGMPHAFSFIYRRIMNGEVIPTVPLCINTYYPPNQPTPKRCYELGRALRTAIESWDRDARVGLIASGGLSHFVIDEELDQRSLAAMKNRDEAAIAALPLERLNSGTSEIRNWFAVAGAAEPLDMEVYDYVPCYRSAAGTGCAMGFAAWT